MGVSQVIIEADDELLRRAERVAAAKGTDVQAVLTSMLSKFASLAAESFDESALPPITRRALGMAAGANIPDDWKEALTEALVEKYGLPK